MADIIVTDLLDATSSSLLLCNDDLFTRMCLLNVFENMLNIY